MAYIFVHDVPPAYADSAGKETQITCSLHDLEKPIFVYTVAQLISQHTDIAAHTHGVDSVTGRRLTYRSFGRPVL
jgi:hypothetical protein